MSAEIREAIAQNPNGSDLEIALAIGVGESSVSKVRAEDTPKLDPKNEMVVQKKTPAKKAAKKAAKKVARDGSLTVKERFYLRDTHGAVFELVRMNASTSSVVLEFVNPTQVKDFR